MLTLDAFMSSASQQLKVEVDSESPDSAVAMNKRRSTRGKAGTKAESHLEAVRTLLPQVALIVLETRALRLQLLLMSAGKSRQLAGRSCYLHPCLPATAPRQW